MRPHPPEAPPRSPFVVGIDAGGSSVRARGASAGTVVHEGHGGPANALSTDPGSLARSFADALSGCPPVDHLVACVAGAGVAQARDRVDRTLRQLQPQARVQVLPDFAAAYHAFDGDVDLVVIAGTGTVVCSPAGTGWRVSGGHGWILGDHGSASRLGRALLEAYLQDPAALPQSTADALEAVYGSREPGALVRFVHMHPAPGAALALAAPLLTELTAQGHALAKSLLDQQMRLLARTTAAHASDMTAGIRPDASWQPRVGLVGGVWAAAVARTSFARALADLAPELHIRPGVGDPLDGALRLAHTFATAR